MRSVILWVAVMVCGLTALLFGAVAVTLLAQGNTGAAVVSVVFTSLPAFVAWKCVGALRRDAAGPAVPPVSPPAANPAGPLQRSPTPWGCPATLTISSPGRSRLGLWHELGQT